MRGKKLVFINKGMSFFIVLGLTVVPVVLLPAQVTVEITPPTLKPGMAQLETMVAAQLEEARTGIEATVNSIANKPLFAGAFAAAAASTGLVPLLALPQTKGVAISVGSVGGIQTASWDFAALGSQLDQATPEIDLATGVGLVPLEVLVDVNLGFLVPGLAVRGSFGWMDTPVAAAGYTFRFQAVQAGGALSWQIGRMPEGLPVAWDGIQVLSGFSWMTNQVGTMLDLDSIVQTFTLDPDGAGPFLPLDMSIRVEPNLEVGLRTESWVVPIQLATGLRLADFLGLNLGGGVDFSGGNAGISIEGTQEVQVLGFLANLIASPASIKISGVTRGAPPNLVHGFLSACVQIRADNFSLSIPVAWRFDDGLSLGLLAGVRL